MKLSFIVPAYNVEGYVDACLDSLTAQDIPAEDYEIIVVNDGSTDSTPAHIRRYAERHANIVVIDQENQGLSAARNAGLARARGEYLWMVDSDDTICRHCLGFLLSAADRLQTDMLCVGPSIPFTEALPITPPHLPLINTISPIYTGREWITSSYYGSPVAWGFLFRRSFWEAHSLRFVEGIVYEDAECISRTFYWARRIATLTQFSLYNYVQRGGSIMHKPFTWHTLQSMAAIVKSMNEFVRNVAGGDPFFKRYYYNVGIGAYINGLKHAARDAGLPVRFDDYVRLVRAGGGAKVTATHPVKRFYQWLAIHCPRLFVKMA